MLVARTEPTPWPALERRRALVARDRQEPATLGSGPGSRLAPSPSTSYALSHIIISIDDDTRDRDDLDAVLAALADPTRRRVVEVLRDGPVRAGKLADGVGMPATALTRHLRTLRRAGVVEAVPLDDDARARLYRLRADRLVGLQAWVDQVTAHWTEQLAGFRTHAERKAAGRKAAEPEVAER